MKTELLRCRPLSGWPCLMLVILAANVATSLPAQSGTKQSFAREPISRPPVIEVPMSRRLPFGQLDFGPASPLTAAADPAASKTGAESSLAKAGEEAFAKGRYLDAANLYDQAAKEANASDEGRQRYLAYRQIEAEALFRQGKSFPDNDALDRSIEPLEKLLNLTNKLSAPLDWAAAKNDLGAALVLSGERFGDHANILRGIADIREALEIRRYDSFPNEWAFSQLELARAFIAGGRISAENAMLEEAIQTCQSVIEWKSDSRIEAAQKLAKSIMANALQQLGQREEDADAAFNAKSSAEDALSGINRDTQPSDWAQTLNYLANANRELGGMQKDASLLLLALEQYDQSLEVRTREAYPIEWAQSQLDKGNAYIDLAYLQNDSAMFERALDAYIKSLKARTERDTPLAWAMSRNNYGVALTKILDFRPEASVADRSSVVSAFRDAARLTTIERSPLHWAMMQVNLGRSLYDLWERKQIDAPKERDAAMDALMQNQIKHPNANGKVAHEAALARINNRSRAVDELEEGIVLFREATKVYTKSARPMSWIKALADIARNLDKIAKRRGEPSLFDEEVEIFREQQTYLQLRYFPTDWANLENSIGAVQHISGMMRNDVATLREAGKAFQNAVSAMPEDQSYGYSFIKQNLARLQCDLGKIASDDSAFDKSARVFEELIHEGTLRGDMETVQLLTHESAQCAAARVDMKAKKEPK
jgi:tetratricopeptide (TPR) repeat protein